MKVTKRKIGREFARRWSRRLRACSGSEGIDGVGVAVDQQGRGSLDSRSALWPIPV